MDTNTVDLEAPETHLRESLQLAEACAIPFERALTLLALAELRVATRQVAEAESLLAEVEEICIPLDAKPTLVRAQALATKLATKVPKHANPFGLTRREVDVLRLLVQGMSDREIG
jgi:DNA-binding NarL/FixJ family response regulator